MLCRESEKVQAHFDGEVDAVTAAEVERHVGHCANCRALLEDLRQIRTRFRRELAPVKAPAELKARIHQALDREVRIERGRPPVKMPAMMRLKPFWAGALSGAGSMLMAAGVFVALLFPAIPTSPLLNDLVTAHVQSLTSQHLVDVVSTDRHTVKPWFAGHADVSPVVADFEAQGYPLVGGRAGFLNHQRAAVTVYRHGAHIINVFTWAIETRSVPRDATRNGYHLAFWRSGNLLYCAVSDTGWDELAGLTRLLQDLGARDSRE